MQLMKIITASALLLFTISAYAHSGGMDAKGCHSKNSVRHCHGENTGKFLPEKEETRIKKLHDSTCTTPDAEGRLPRSDLYGKRCNNRKVK